MITWNKQVKLSNKTIDNFKSVVEMFANGRMRFIDENQRSILRFINALEEVKLKINFLGQRSE